MPYGGKRKGRTEDDEDNVKSSDGIIACEISKNRKVSVKKFKGMILVDIREYWNKDGASLPGKKGISLTFDQWKILCEHIDTVDQALEES